MSSAKCKVSLSANVRVIVRVSPLQCGRPRRRTKRQLQPISVKDQLKARPGSTSHVLQRAARGLRWPDTQSKRGTESSSAIRCQTTPRAALALACSQGKPQQSYWVPPTPHMSMPCTRVQSNGRQTSSFTLSHMRRPVGAAPGANDGARLPGMTNNDRQCGSLSFLRVVLMFFFCFFQVLCFVFCVYVYVYVYVYVCLSMYIYDTTHTTHHHHHRHHTHTHTPHKS